MDDLVRWLGEQLDEDTARATAAAEEDGPDWQYDGHAVITRREGDLVAVGSQDFMELERGEHIAEWDPARVLREIDAKRRMLVLHTGMHGCSVTDETGYHLNYADVDRGDACTTLRLLALPYADRPGYREEWAP